MNQCKCPYCGKRISYFTALAIRRRGEYYCKRCKKESNVHINRTIWVMYFAVLVISLIVMGYFILISDRQNPWFILLVAVPFFLFFIFSPLFVRLRPKKKFQDALYDTDMMNAPIIEPDPTMASTAKVAPAFMDDIADHTEYRPAIDPSVFNAIKDERKAVSDVDGGTKAFDRFENISSSGDEIGSTKLVGNLNPPARQGRATDPNGSRYR